MRANLVYCHEKKTPTSAATVDLLTDATSEFTLATWRDTEVGRLRSPSWTTSWMVWQAQAHFRDLALVVCGRLFADLEPQHNSTSRLTELRCGTD